jgi:gliding motility-associated-like protein
MLAGILISAALRLSAQNEPSSFEFIENKGQWDTSVQFKGELYAAEFYIQKKGFMVALHNPKDVDAASNQHAGNKPVRDKSSQKISYKPDLSGRVTDESITARAAAVNMRSHAYAVEFTGGNENALIVPDKVQPYFNNYFIGDDHSKWARKVKIFGAVLYKDIYPNIDVRYYSENARLKYDLIIRPGGDPSRIQMKYTGADKLSVRNNELVIKTSVGDVKELYPYSFQSDNIKGRKEITCKYVITGTTVKFDVGNYSKNTVLVIDPSLIFSSFTGSMADQYGYTATPGPDGSLFSGGIVFGQGFPVTTGAYQSNYSPSPGSSKFKIDIGIMKFSPNGAARVYATYLGGAGNDFPHSLISDPQGNLIIMGRTTSPGGGGRPEAYPGTVIGTDLNTSIVVTKLNADGSDIIGSLIIGGSSADGVNIESLQEVGQSGNHKLIRNYGDDTRSEVTIDAANNIYVAAQTQSADFPVKNAFQPVFGGLQDGVVMKITPDCNSLTWASYLGGEGYDGAFVIDVSPTTGDVYVGGGTTSAISLPGTSGAVKYPIFQGGETDGFITEISNNGALIRSSYLGTTGNDIVYGLKFDKLGFPYVMGVSRGGNWPVVKASAAGAIFYSVPKSSQFIAKLKPDLSDFVYSTVFGSGSPKPNMSPVAFLVDRCENLYVSGWGGWIVPGAVDLYDQVGVNGMPITPDAIKGSTDNKDFYFIVIQKNSSKLLYGTYFGQDGGQYGEHVDGGTSRYDKQGVIYQAICANCYGGAKFPTTPGVVGPVNGMGDHGCNLAAVKISFNFAGVAAGPESFVNGIHDSLGCAPFSVTLQDTVRNAVSYIWKFGDGSADTSTTSYTIDHIYNSVGNYKVTLIAIDSNSCNVSDTALTYIRVGDDRARLALAFAKDGPCESLNYKFDNLSTYNVKPFNDSSFVWDFGDGTLPVRTGSGSVTHPYSNPGAYIVKLMLVDTGYCNSPDEIDTTVRVNPLVKAQFETPPVGCAPYSAVFNNISLAGIKFRWEFGDGTIDTLTTSPTHLYQDPGQFTIKLTAYDEGTCNKISDTSMSIIVSGSPTAEFSYVPVTPVQNKPNIFTNLSTGGITFTWLFGDGDSVVKKSMDTVLHQYNATGTYNACLVATNEYGCSDTVCHPVAADILPLLDVPNAFTPGRFGRNAVISVQGFGIARMSWKIYNRFGQKVYETNDRRGGWDGKFNGQLQPMDVYAYTLDVVYTDGKKTRKTGDITLLK